METFNRFFFKVPKQFPRDVLSLILLYTHFSLMVFPRERKGEGRRKGRGGEGKGAEGRGEKKDFLLKIIQVFFLFNFPLHLL